MKNERNWRPAKEAEIGWTGVVRDGEEDLYAAAERRKGGWFYDVPEGEEKLTFEPSEYLLSDNPVGKGKRDV